MPMSNKDKNNTINMYVTFWEEIYKTNEASVENNTYHQT
jgi:hypothetical protein